MEIDLLDITSQRYEKHVEFRVLKDNAGEFITSIITNTESPTPLRCAAIISLLHQKDYFQELSYSEKINLLDDFFAIQGITLKYDPNYPPHPVKEHIISQYAQLLTSDKDLVSFAKLIQTKASPMYHQIVTTVCQRLQDSDDAHAFLRELAMRGYTIAGRRLAAFRKLEDISVLSAFFLPPKNSIGRNLPQFSKSDFESAIPLPILEMVFQFLPPHRKIYVRSVCKKWFNDLNDEKLWEKSCKEKGFGHIPRFSWLQSYFLQVNKVVVRHETYENFFEISAKWKVIPKILPEIMCAFPDPLFLALVTLLDGMDIRLFDTAITHYSPQEALEFLQLPFFPTHQIPAFFLKIKSKNWHTDPTFADFFLLHFIDLFRTMANDTMQMLFDSKRAKLIESLESFLKVYSFDFFHHIINPLAQNRQFVMDLILKEERLTHTWHIALLGLSDHVWLKNKLIDYVHDLPNENLVVQILSQKLNSTDHSMLISEAIKILGKYDGGIPILLEFRQKHETNEKYCTMVDESLEASKQRNQAKCILM